MTFSKKRRRFIQSAVFSGIGIIACPNIIARTHNITQEREKLKPQSIDRGDTVALISPSAAQYENHKIEMAIEALQKFRLEVLPARSLKNKYGYLAGTDMERAAEINEMFQNPNVKAIICLRGGFGATRILDLIDYEAIQRNPKIFIGFSDITAFLLAIYAKTGLVTFHGPNGIASWNSFTRTYFMRLLFENQMIIFKPPPKSASKWVQTSGRIRVIRGGKVVGKLLGGNLTVLCSLAGSDYLPDFENCILFVEDVGEKLYRIDRLMSQLKLAGILDKLSGFVFGYCVDCEPSNGYGSLTFDQIIDHYLLPLNIPAFSGAMIGHINSQFTLPIGVNVEMNAFDGTLAMTEYALQ